MHHVDLGLGYEPSDWPEDYVAWELPVLLATVPDRVHRQTMFATLWRGCRAGGRSRPRSSLIRGEVRTPPLGGETTGDHGALRQRNIMPRPAAGGMLFSWRGELASHNYAGRSGAQTPMREAACRFPGSYGSGTRSG